MTTKYEVTVELDRLPRETGRDGDQRVRDVARELAEIEASVGRGARGV